MNDLKQLADEAKQVRSELVETKTQLMSLGNDNETATQIVGYLEGIIDGFDAMITSIANRDAMLAEMSGALAQLMGTADKPKDPNTARYFADALDRARAVQEMYSRQLGNG